MSSLSTRIVQISAVLLAAGYIGVYATGRASAPIRSDGFSYYVYLPSWFIFGDPTLAAVAHDCCGGEFPEYTAIVRWPGTRQWVNAHPIGVAIMQAPVFLAAHGLTKWSNLSADGFTLYYQHAAGLSGLIWTVAGLWVLRGLLRRHFIEGVTAATLLVVLFGTSLFHYATYDSTYSHAYSFFLFSAFLDVTERWHRHPSRGLSILVGLAGGLIVLTRHTNVLFLLVFALYGVTGRSSLGATIERFRTHWRELAVVFVSATAVVAPQLAIYYQATGHALVSPYGALGFDFGAPRLFGVLFSVQKGVFFWSPLLLLGVVGLAMARQTVRPFLLPVAVFLVVNTYLIASWWDWQFGGSYGHRGFVDSLPIFALGIATVFEWSARQPVRRAVTALAAGVLVALSIFQMLQYWNGVIPISDTTWGQYRAAFLRFR